MTIETYIVIATFIFLIVAFLLEAMRPGLILFSAAVIFLATGIISGEEMVAGFSNNGIITIAVLFLVNEGIKQAGLITRLAQIYLPRKKSPMPLLIPRIMIPVSLFSAFLNNLPIVVNVIPLLMKWADMMRFSYKKFLIPLSYAAIFGGMCTLIGTSSNLVVHGLMLESGFQGFHLFELGKLGLVISLFGIVYMALVSNWLLPGKKMRIMRGITETKDYYYNLQLTENSSLIGQVIENPSVPGLNGLQLYCVERNGKTLYPGKNNIKLRQNDDILVMGTSDRLNYILAHKDIKLKGEEYLHNESPADLKQYEVVLSPRFAGLGLTVTEYNFFEHFNAVVLAIHRNGERITSNLNKLKLKVGDNVVLLSTDQFLSNWETSHMFYLVNYLQDYRVGKTSRTRWIALVILAAMVLGIVINELVSWGYGMRLNIFLFVAAAAILLVWLKILPSQNYTKNISWDLIISVASAFAISKGIQNSGIAQSMAEDAVNVVKSIGPAGVLAIIYIVTAVLTEIITNNAAVALVFPVAVLAAELLGVNAKPFFVAIAIAAASSFMTARGYRANLIIKSIGKYSYRDFLRIGTPMQIIAFVVSVWLIPYYWAF
ncbi:SLC13 family permease [Maribellus maritimus]|uniref:SLC13 family permease n=1 Tax=Maribellus maritimus TaxID=2870838 RepID=UPI001EEACB1A|nr:SLC13 family permease [Maribellus maritimus]MCG6191516.1 SLC13 family permease [Maribellus maritimus]